MPPGNWKPAGGEGTHSCPTDVPCCLLSAGTCWEGCPGARAPLAGAGPSGGLGTQSASPPQSSRHQPAHRWVPDPARRPPQLCFSSAAPAHAPGREVLITGPLPCAACTVPATLAFSCLASLLGNTYTPR